jgi:hypothetical protein
MPAWHDDVLHLLEAGATGGIEPPVALMFSQAPAFPVTLVRPGIAPKQAVVLFPDPP